jgi:hypothetical protein
MSKQTEPDPSHIAQILRRVLDTLSANESAHDDEARAFLSAEIKKLEGAGNDD